jgi:hypothetical protein
MTIAMAIPWSAWTRARTSFISAMIRALPISLCCLVMTIAMAIPSERLDVGQNLIYFLFFFV